MACNYLDPASCVSNAISDSVGMLAKSFADSATYSVKTMMSAWMGVPSPTLDGSGVSTVAWLQDRLAYLVLVAAVVSVLYAAYRMATSGEFRHAGDLAASLLKLIVVTGCVTTVTTIGLEVGDAYAHWMLADTAVFSKLIVFTMVTSPGVVLVLSVVVIIAQVIQLCLMLVKNAMVVALVGFLPLTAAATNTTTGKQGFHKAITWLAAFVLYKPVAATVYAIAFKLSSGGQTIADQMSGIALMILAIVALPALMRFLVPAAAAVTGGNAGALAGAVVGAGLATGAVILTGGAAAGAGGFSAGASGLAAGGGAAGGGAAAGVSGVGGVGPSGAAGATGASGGTPAALQAAASGAQLGGGSSTSTDDVVDKT